MTSVIRTKHAECKDCYRCLRVCPVKAISFTTETQAMINDERCIMCGRCVVECPQNAKIVQNEVYKVKDFLYNKQKTVLSLAPSFPASFVEDGGQVIDALMSLGFTAVEETAIGAVFTTEAYKKILRENTEDKTYLSSCCPVVVNLIEKYYPDLKKNVLPVISPMVAHARYIKEKYGEETKVVFAGPCIAKLKEAEENGVDVAVTFKQLKDIMPPIEQKENKQSNKKYDLKTRMFPVHHGVTFAMRGQWGLDEDYWCVEGIRQCREVLEALRNNDIKPKFIELMACEGGCVGGPAVDSPYSLFRRKQKVMEYYHQSDQQVELEKPQASFSMTKKFTGQAVKEKEFSEEEIRKVLFKMGKITPGDERNCEGCGYKSCREKAIAVLSGLAVPEMCIPYMKARAESFANTIVKNTPNAILVVDKDLKVVDFNPSAERIFKHIPFKKGIALQDYINVDNYLAVLHGHQIISGVKIIYPEWGLVTREIITPLGKDDMVMAIITDLTQTEENLIHVQKMKEDVTVKAKEVIHRQMMVAQTIAGLLGETTAETKATLLELCKQLECEKL